MIRFVEGESLSVLFNEPKLLKSQYARAAYDLTRAFSALQRAEIAEILIFGRIASALLSTTFSALQRAEIAEIQRLVDVRRKLHASFQCSSTSRNC